MNLLNYYYYYVFLITANQEWEQNLRIYNLQLERERLKTRRQEIAKLNVRTFVIQCSKLA